MTGKVDLSDNEFYQHYLQNAQHMMWFLGAGTSRSAGLPTATDIIWDLKHRHYCLHENQNYQTHDINNHAVKSKIQGYMDSRGFPHLWSPEEYSFYFDLTFGNDYEAQRKYLQEALASDKVSLNIGHRVLAALLEMKLARIVFTTNFDDVIETAFSFVSGKYLPVFHLEGSYAALSALNSDSFPIYAKIHGDFRYQSIKNLSEDLRNNDQEIQKCFLAASTRFGLVVSGYSGRDENVMTMFRAAIDQNNAFPHGLFWTVPALSKTEPNVQDLITYAQDKGIRAFIVETGTFDEMLSKIWRQVTSKPQSIDAKVRTAHAYSVSIPLPAIGKTFPALRTNALPVATRSIRCGTVDVTCPVTFSELRERVRQRSSTAIMTKTDKVLFFGDRHEVSKVFNEDEIKSIAPCNFADIVQNVADSTVFKAFIEQAILTALLHGKPLLHRVKHKTHYAVVPNDSAKDDTFLDLRKAVGSKGNLGEITGKVPFTKELTWAEAVSIRLEERGGRLWIMLKPDIWIKPLAKREEATDFMRTRRRYRYNQCSYQILDAWIKILLGSVGDGNMVKVTCFPDTEFCGVFEIGTRSAYSLRGGHGQ
ncbi:SIR2 family NAD-dependent protein deacylase [Geobacter sulfurreducens]|uniref:SIR2 family NAD-dependent protein deacylase n=1 Tax=Geobacter sulfurreducens TaxID=35554 RepID=UPI000DBB3BD4|nr:SIR2 family protein [Geobacter sulfurreducens]BBA68611.1 hypothetical protein YM18_0051 [Geobacter sulfurreducens]HMN15673.1 SIR2 family protein [Bellilinea sp.]